jgi:hypothetical protein
LPLPPYALTRASSSCHPSGASTSRPCSTRGRVVHRWGLANDEPAPLIGFCFLQAYMHPSSPGYPRPIHPRRFEPDLRSPADRARAPPASIQGASRRLRLRNRPPARSFMPSVPLRRASR